MHRSYRRFLAAFLASACLIAGVGVVEARADTITGQELLQRIRRTYNRVQTFRADFDHTFVWELAGTSEQTSGTFWMKKPHGFRIQTPAQTVVTDGETVWSYSPATRQVIINDYRPESMPLRPDNFLFNFPDEERVTYTGDERIDGKNCHVMEMVPRDSTLGIMSMKVWVNPETWLAVKAEYRSADGNITRYVLRNVEMNPSIPDAQFRFTPQQGVETLDFRAGAETGSR